MLRLTLFDLHNANRGLLVIPHLPGGVDFLERAVFFETSKSLVQLVEDGRGIGVALVETAMYTSV